ncbi:MAG TPA: ABC transporter ATP-binding protein [Candidatus Fraserbacteria bacterium]|nr:ABC transporter ATP-binding protein [Candidatus Fraserbacteria bacterium]
MGQLNDDLVLHLSEVQKRFDDVTAVAGVSFGVQRGELFGLLGPNGAGKTTLIRMILGITRPDRGQIEFALPGGTGRPRQERVGYLPEERGLYEDRQVGDTLLYLAALRGLPCPQARERILYWLDRLELGRHFRSRLKELSKGMQQKIQFIAAVLHQPDLVVLDEPFAGLDPVNQDLFQEIIRELSAGGMTVLLSSHQMNLVEQLCDRVFLINHGRQVLYGRLDQIKRDYGQKLVQLKYQGDGQTLLAGLPVHQLSEGRIEVLLPKDTDINSFLQTLLEQVAIEEISVAHPPLHRIFVELVHQSQEEVADAP